MDRRIGAASAVPVCSGEEGAEPEGEALELSIYVPTLTYGH